MIPKRELSTESERLSVNGQYAELAERYRPISDSHASRETGLFRFHFARSCVEKALASQVTSLVIDIGCGSGGLLEWFSARHPRTRFFGIDICEPLIRKARERSLGPNVEVRVANLVEELPKLSALVSSQPRAVLVLLWGPMVHFGPTDEFTRALRLLWSKVSRGRLVATFHNRDLLFGIRPRRPTKHYWRPAEAIEEFRESGDQARVDHYTWFPSDQLAGWFPRSERALVAVEKRLMLAPLFLRRVVMDNFCLTVERSDEAGSPGRPGG